MAKFRLKATKCKFEDSGTPGIARVMSFMVFSDDIVHPAPRVIEAANGAQLTAAMQEFSAEVAAQTLRSYFVTEFLLRGERAFAGYRQKKWTVKVDRDPGAKVAA